MPDVKPTTSLTYGDIRVRGNGSRALAAKVANAVTAGLESSLVRMSQQLAQRGQVDVAKLRICVPEGASAVEISRALEHAISRAIRDSLS
jgi:hypothetical protein